MTQRTRQQVILTTLKSKAKRDKLEADREPYWAKYPVEDFKGLSLGFRRSPITDKKTRHARVFLDGKYFKETLGPVGAATKENELDYAQAYRAAKEWARPLREVGPVVAQEYNLEDVVDDYLKGLQGNGSNRLIDKRRQAEKRLDALLTDALLRKKVNDLTKRDLTRLQRDYSQRPSRNIDPQTKEPILISPDSVNRV